MRCDLRLDDVMKHLPHFYYDAINRKASTQGYINKDCIGAEGFE